MTAKYYLIRRLKLEISSNIKILNMNSFFDIILGLFGNFYFWITNVRPRILVIKNVYKFEIYKFDVLIVAKQIEQSFKHYFKTS